MIVDVASGSLVQEVEDHCHSPVLASLSAAAAAMQGLSCYCCMDEVVVVVESWTLGATLPVAHFLF